MSSSSWLPRSISIFLTPNFTYKSTVEKEDVFRGFTSRQLASEAPSSYKRLMEHADKPSNDPLLTAVGLRVQKLREAAGIRPADFARSAGITQPYLWRLEGGQQNLNLKSLSRLALALGVPMSVILEGIEPDPSTLGKRPYRKRSEF